VDVPELLGRTVHDLDASAAPACWVFRLGEDYALTITCPWRLVIGGKVALAGNDHMQSFGLKEPVDIVKETLNHLMDRRLTRASLDQTGDVTLVFEGGATLETFTDSLGYESCVIWLGTRQLVITGGGRVVEP